MCVVVGAAIYVVVLLFVGGGMFDFADLMLCFAGYGVCVCNLGVAFSFVCDFWIVYLRVNVVCFSLLIANSGGLLVLFVLYTFYDLLLIVWLGLYLFVLVMFCFVCFVWVFGFVRSVIWLEILWVVWLAVGLDIWLFVFSGCCGVYLFAFVGFDGMVLCDYRCL